ncbi:hypothetical protein COMA1_30400 [Candidatus Nitrospira nitrosa]|uniref:Uncharacterized protein n=1 Tax=Candidatus Nitrospira nitrosa TaxID=1742972 RepID=A0A0S4LHM9_9BACT|nr:hypothetical protein COMA1_30400 [Candidatus Nitrospira nitrosa]
MIAGSLHWTMGDLADLAAGELIAELRCFPSKAFYLFNISGEV